MSDHFISVIIPVFNGSKTLYRCLESVFASSYPYFECILVDDHSTDDSLSVARTFDTEIIRLNTQGGAAHARNRGAQTAQGDILLFVDADVMIYPDSIDKVVNTFDQHPEISAVFGSYDDQPACSNFCSQYKNLFHHYIHQTSREDATTFWSGCGAIKKDVFLGIGKFNENCSMMEDIELGYKLKAKNYTILLSKELVVKHLKHYSFSGLVRSDILDRAIPWTILMLSKRQFTNDLNLKLEHKLSAVVLILMIASILMTIKSTWFVLAIPIFLCLYFATNFDFYGFFLRKRGLVFTLKVIPLHFLYYLYSSFGFLVGCCKNYFNK